MSIRELTRENFDSEVMKSEKPVLIDFWASWCDPCKMLSPIVDEIAEEEGDRIKVCKVNVDDQEALAAQFGVMSIPTLIVMKDGKIVNRSVGYKPKQDVKALVK